MELAGRLRRRRTPRRWPAATWALRVAGVLRGATGTPPDDLQARLDAAQLPGDIDASALMALKVGLAVCAGATAFVAASLEAFVAAPLVLLAAPVCGFLLPDLILRRRARRIGREVAAEVPELADRLHLAISAGLAPLAAAAIAGGASEGTLSRELSRAAATACAGEPLAGALERLVRRCPAPGARSIAAALLRSQEQGTDIAPALLAIAESARRDASLRLRDRAQRASPKIQLVVALLLVPAAMCLIAAALISGLRFSP